MQFVEIDFGPAIQVKIQHRPRIKPTKHTDRLTGPYRVLAQRGSSQLTAELKTLSPLHNLMASLFH